MIQEGGARSRKQRIRDRLEREIPKRQAKPRVDFADEQLHELFVKPEIDSITVTTIEENGQVIEEEVIEPSTLSLKDALEKALNAAPDCELKDSLQGAIKHAVQASESDTESNTQENNMSITDVKSASAASATDSAETVIPTATKENIMANQTNSAETSEFITTAEKRRIARAAQLATAAIEEAVKFEAEGKPEMAELSRQRAVDFLSINKKETVADKVADAVDGSAKSAETPNASAAPGAEPASKSNDNKEEPKVGFFKRHWKTASGFAKDHKVACAAVAATAVAVAVVVLSGGEVPEATTAGE